MNAEFSHPGSAGAFAGNVRRLAERNRWRKRFFGEGAEKSTRGACAPQRTVIGSSTSALKTHRTEGPHGHTGECLCSDFYQFACTRHAKLTPGVIRRAPRRPRDLSHEDIVTQVTSKGRSKIIPHSRGPSLRSG